MVRGVWLCVVFFFNDTATTEIYTLSLHDALPIWGGHGAQGRPRPGLRKLPARAGSLDRKSGSAGMPRPISYAVFCLKNRNTQPHNPAAHGTTPSRAPRAARPPPRT